MFVGSYILRNLGVLKLGRVEIFFEFNEGLKNLYANLLVRMFGGI